MQEFAAGSCSSKIKIRGMPSRLLEDIPEQAVLKELLWNLYEIKVFSIVCILKMERMYSFTGAQKALFFTKIISNQTKVVNESVS